jgi:putative transcriptional regulator
MPISKRNDDGANADPADRPITASDLRRMKRTPQVKIIRRALGLTQEEFSARYRIPLGTLRDWEQGRTEPDQTAKAYLRVIATEPTTTAKALKRTAA